MQVKLLKEIVSSIAGQEADKIVDLLHGKKNVNEFNIAKKLDLTINQTRNILYKLLDQGLVRFVRKKDSKKGGWYTYFWTLDPGKSLAKFKERLDFQIKTLQDSLHIKRTKRFLHCPNCDIELSEEEALTHEYACQECGELLEIKDGGDQIEDMEKKLLEYKNLLEDVEVELDIVVAKEQKAKIRRIKVEEKAKIAKRKATREASAKKRAKAKADEEKKSGKKKTKKKVVKKKTAKKVSKKLTKKAKNKKAKVVGKKKTKKKVVKKDSKNVKKKTSKKKVVKKKTKKRKLKSDISKLEGALAKVNRSVGGIFGKRKKGSKK
jgi:transcription factor E